MSPVCIASPQRPVGSMQHPPGKDPPAQKDLLFLNNLSFTQSAELLTAIAELMAGGSLRF